MSLGILNNLSAVYAENNLNSTNNSLNTVLQQLSSGSKINSGADDAAGLSLVDGLEANQTALNQSQTNASEGAGLLQVADGALSQVTSLLNRAVSLATEASNGTLDSSQDTAANQEYQSILSEINNIGATTTYNQEQVFGSNTNIYTGDSSTAGSSVNSLSIRTLSSSNVGDTGGVMSYSNGQNNVFMNLSTSTANASLGDTLNSNGATTMNVNYLVPGAIGSSTIGSAQITVGGSSGYQNTVGGMIDAINQSGLGLSASFTTQAQAGVEGGGAETGIEISGGLVSAGVAPSSSSTSGTLDLTGLAAGATLAQGATVTINQGNDSQTFTIGENNNTLATLAAVINGSTGATNIVSGDTGQTLGVTASVITNGDGTQSLALADAPTFNGALSVSTTAGTTQAPSFAAAGTTGSSVTVEQGSSTLGGVQYIASTASHVTVGTSGGDATTENLTAGTQITITNSNFAPNGAQAVTFIVGQGTNVIGAHADTFYTGSMSGVGNSSDTDSAATSVTLQGLADAVNAVTGTLGATASAGPTGLVVTANTAATNENLTVSGNSLTSSTTGTQLALYTPQVAGDTLVAGTTAKTVLDDGTGNNVVGNTLSGSITLTNSYGSTTFTSGAGTDGNGTVYLGNWGGNTYTGLAAAINHYSATLGYGAAWNATAGAAGTPALVLTGNANGNNPITVTGSTTLIDTSDTNAAVGVDASGTGSVTPTNGTDHQVATSSTAILQLASGNITDTGGSASTLSGTISLTFNGNTQVFIMGGQPTNGTAVAGAIYTGASTVTSLVNAINSAGALGLQASAPGGGTGGIYLQGGQGIAQAITMNAVAAGTETQLAVASGIAQSSQANGATGQAGNNAVYNITATTNLGAATTVNTSDTMSGQVQITNQTVTDTFIIGAGSNSAVAGTFYTDNTDLHGADYGNTLAGLAQAITAYATNSVSAQATASGLTLTQAGTSTSYSGGNISANTSTSGNSLVDVTEGTYSTDTTSNQLASENDTLSGALVFNVGSSASQTVTMAQVAASAASGHSSTVQGLIAYINANSSTLGVSANWVPNTSGNTSFGNIQLVSGTEGTGGTVNISVGPTGLTSLTDTTSGAALSYKAGSAYNVGLSSSSGSTKVLDSTDDQAAAGFAADQKSGSGIATISYSDGAGQSLNTTDLTSQADAQTALTNLNTAIADVAAQDGYIGAQINTLNAVSSVLSTQSENVQSAQNAVQATDYAEATSNMSKYEILSQTGIAALAQANSQQQAVLKLLQ